MKKKLLKMVCYLQTAILLVGTPVVNVHAEEHTSHQYSATQVQVPTCESGGSITYECSVEGCDVTKSFETGVLTHTDLAVVKLPQTGTSQYNTFIITNPGQDNVTPFKFLDFGSKQSYDVTFYIYNDTGVTLKEVSLCYNYGKNAYATNEVTASTPLIAGTNVALNLAPGSGTEFTLTVPKECYFSNKAGQLTDGNANVYDSQGNLVSYRDMGLRFDISANDPTGGLYITCLTDSTVTELLSRASIYRPSNSNGGEMITGDDIVVPAKMVGELVNLTNEELEVTKLPPSGSGKFVVTEAGQDYVTPFKDLSFGDGEFCDVQFYVYNDTAVTLNTASLSYQYGTKAYATNEVTASTPKVEGTSVEIKLAPGTSGTFTLKVPRECYFSNSDGKLTQGQYDSLGNLVSYKDMGLRFDVADAFTDGALYIACLSDDTVTEKLSETNIYRPIDSSGSQLITDDEIAVPTEMVGVLTEYYGDIECVHCDEPQGGATDDGSDIPDSEIGVVLGTVETWVSKEIIFRSTKEYDDPYNDVVLDLKISTTIGNETVTYTIPAFWDGGKIWRARFMCPNAGDWTFQTVCNDTKNTGLHNVSGEFDCVEYTGDLEIYQRGFVKTSDDKNYFTYADGTPFFYLGDTHWRLGLETVEMVEVICEDRVDKGFTVFQSEPIRETFSLRDGVTKDDLAGFANYDAKFKVIAESGLVHANAEFFYTGDMDTFIKNHGGWDTTKNMGTAAHPSGTVEIFDLSDEAKEALAKLTRYWVARYGSYPVMWTLGQEADNDFYWERDGYNSHQGWNYLMNPYVYVAEYIGQYDPYSSPLTAHMENVTDTVLENSAFRDVEEHTWYAAQWKQNMDIAPNFEVLKQYYEDSQGKPVVYYEGGYCYLWTKNFGARVQGWMAYLNGMFGASWGGQDTWSYLSDYNEDRTSYDGVDVVTPADKSGSTWESTLYFSSTYQMGYMREFMENIVGDWYNLIPRFDNTAYFEPTDKNVFSIHASNADKSKNVIYFYNFSDGSLAKMPNASAEDAVKTGTLKNMVAGATYNYTWFNPVYGQIVESGELTANANGELILPEKDTCDMTLYVTLANEGCQHADTRSYEAKNATCTQFGNNAYTYCVDCNEIITDNYGLTDVVAHTPNGAQSCTSAVECTACGRIITDVLGHQYEETNFTDVSCEQGGQITYECKVCQDTYVYNAEKLTHTGFEVAKVDWKKGNWYNVLQFGQLENSPFKFMDFGDGDTCDIVLYIYNDSGSPLDEVAISYNWGHWVYADKEAAAKGERVPGTYVNDLNLQAGESTIVTLTIPKKLCVSNSDNAVSDFVYDTKGEALSYRELGLRFNKEENVSDSADTSLYVACLSDSSVTEMISRTKRYSESNKPNELVTDSAAVPAKVASDLGTIYGETECIHCTPNEGYVAGITAENVKVEKGDIVKIPVAISHNTEETFNACEIKISYDDDVFTFNAEQSILGTGEVSTADDSLTLEDFGADKAFGTRVYVLAFEAKETATVGNTTIELIAAAFNNDVNASTQNLKPAVLSPASVEISVIEAALEVTIDKDMFTGADEAAYGEDYTFSWAENGEYYDYINVAATMGGVAKDVIDNQDGTYTIENVTEALIITATRTPKIFRVTYEGTGGEDAADVEGNNDDATYLTNYTFTLPKNTTENIYSVESVTIGGKAYTDYAASNGVYTINGTDVKGAIVITIAKGAVTEDYVTVTIGGTGAGVVDGDPIAKKEEAYTLTLAPEAGYLYEVTATMGGQSATVIDNGDNTYTINDVNDVIVFTITRSVDTSGLRVSEEAYVKVDGLVVWLVTNTTEVADGKVPTYDGQKMFWSDEYDAYCYLVIANTMTVEEAREKLDIAFGDATTIDYGMDVNKTGQVDANDAQLTYNIYKAMYNDFNEEVTVEKFLCADINADAVVNVNDAAAIITYILNPTAAE